MQNALRWAWLVAFVVSGCSQAEEGSGDDATETAETSTTMDDDAAPGESASDPADGDPRCVTGCEATLAAGCSGGPPTLEVCIDDCNELAMGTCAAEYQTLMACAEGKSVGCDATGFPVVHECQSAQATFIQCINQ